MPKDEEIKKEKEVKTKKPFNWKKAVAIGAIVLTVFSVAAVAVGCNTNTMHQGNERPGFSQDGGNNGGGVVDPDINQGGNNQDDPVITPGPGGNGGQDDPVIDQPVDPPVVEITEAEYKEMFETNILAAIQNDYNENQKFNHNHISNAEIELINYETGDVYFTAERNNIKVFIVANHEEIADWATYEALNENFPTEGFEFSSAYTVQEDALAEEIAKFALTQTAVQTYAKENDIDLLNYKVINVTEFKGTTNGTKSDLVLLTEDGVLTFSLIGTTGACSSQEEYLTKLKSASNTRAEKFNLVQHYEIPTGTAESSADYGFEF